MANISGNKGLRAPSGNRLSSSMEPQGGLHPSGFCPARLEEWMIAATIRANDAWTRDRSVSISCTPNGFWIEGRQLVRELKMDLRAQQLRPYSQVFRAGCDILTEAVERVLNMLEGREKRARAEGIAHD